MASLVFQLRDGKSVEFELSSPVVTLGRAADNDIVIDNAWISSHHARFERTEGGIAVIDLGSHNGLMVNEHRVTAAVLKPGDRLVFGQLEADFRDAGAPPVAAAAVPAGRGSAAATVPLASAAGPALRSSAIPPPIQPVALTPAPPPWATPPPAADISAGPPPAPASATDVHWATVHHLATGLIKRLDLLDDLLARVLQQGEGETAEHLRRLRESLLEWLREHTIEPYFVDVGMALDVATRKRINIVEPTRDAGGVTEIAEVFRPGYVCQNGPGGTPTILRKAEVRTARQKAPAPGQAG